MKKLIREILNKNGYEIIKQAPKSKKYPNISNDPNEIHCITPMGEYFFPKDAIKDGVVDTMLRGVLFEKENIEIAKRYIKPDSTVLDVGANFGQMSIEFSRMVGKNGSVYSFEGQDTVFRFLKKNVLANNCPNVICFDGAVYNENGKELIFPEPNFNDGNPYGANAINPTLTTGRKVTTFTIDSLNIETPISFMKVDIQGSDIFAMQGAKQTIMRNRMPILFEFEQQFQHQFSTSFQDYVDFVHSINYKFLEIFSQINYLIIPKEK